MNALKVGMAVLASSFFLFPSAFGEVSRRRAALVASRINVESNQLQKVTLFQVMLSAPLDSTDEKAFVGWWESPVVVTATAAKSVLTVKRKGATTNTVEKVTLAAPAAVVRPLPVKNTETLKR